MPRVTLFRRMSGVQPISSRTSAYGCRFRRASAAMREFVREFEWGESAIGRWSGCGAHDRVAREWLRFGVPKVNGEQNGHGDRVAVELRGNELQLSGPARGGRIEIRKPARLLDAGRVLDDASVAIDEERQGDIALNLSCVEHGRVSE